MKAYIIAISDSFGARRGVQNFLDTIDRITFWYACLPNCIFCTSDLSSKEIASLIRKEFGDKRFFVMEYNSNSQGWLPKQAWHLMQQPDNPRLPEE